jgi:membrane protein DedA with SNARE-associated domain
MQVVHHLIHIYGYGGLFALLFVEMLGIPIPVEATLAFAGFAWMKGTFSLLPLLLVTMAGNIGGATAAYCIGRFAGRRVLISIGRRVGLKEERLAQVEQRFRRYSVVLLLFSKFVLGIRVFVPYLAGINRISFVTFSIYNSISAALWVTTYIFFGKYIHLLWNRYQHLLQSHMIPVALFLAGLLLALAAFVYWRKRRIPRSKPIQSGETSDTSE